MKRRFYITLILTAITMHVMFAPVIVEAQETVTLTAPIPTTSVSEAVVSSDYYTALADAEREIEKSNNHVVAISGSRVITSYDLAVEAAVRTIRIKGYDAWRNGETAMSRAQLLEILINQQLVAQEAEQFQEIQQSVQAERKLLSSALEDLWGRFPDLDSRDRFLKQSGISVISITNLLIREIIVEIYLQQKLSQTVTVTKLSVMIEMARNPGKYKSTEEAHQAVLEKQLKRQQRVFIRNLRQKTDIRILVQLED